MNLQDKTQPMRGQIAQSPLMLKSVPTQREVIICESKNVLYTFKRSRGPHICSPLGRSCGCLLQERLYCQLRLMTCSYPQGARSRGRTYDQTLSPTSNMVIRISKSLYSSYAPHLFGRDVYRSSKKVKNHMSPACSIKQL